MMIKIKKEYINFIILFLVVLASAILSIFVYNYTTKKSDDPRLTQTRKNIGEFDNLMKKAKYSEAEILLDIIENVYITFPFYKDSYESGIVMNNRASIFLSKALYDSTITDSLTKVRFLAIAEKYSDQAVFVYQKWIKKFKGKSKADLLKISESYYTKDMPGLEDQNINWMRTKKARELAKAQKETPRRLSVTYANLGTIKRHQLDQDSALIFFMEAIKIWPKNKVAKHNLNMLLNLPIEDQSAVNSILEELNN